MSENSLTLKTPISFLQELCARKGVTPKYDLMSIEGAVHEPTFVYRVSVGEVTATGTGQSKKKAKHSAAKAVLTVMLSERHILTTPSTTVAAASILEHQNHESEATGGMAPMLSPYDDGIPGNPVGALQEMCMSRRWPPPCYEVVDEDGLPHERMFTIACITKKCSEKGTGKSKKLAKRQAAYKMLERLKGIPSTTEKTNNDDDDDEPLPGFKDLKIPSLIPTVGQKISQFYKNIKASPGVSLTRLHSRLSCGDPIEQLRNISHEHRFEVTYVEIEERSRTGKFQFLVQLSTLPVAVCHGTADTAEEAKRNAAENALEFLKIMTRE